MANLSCDRPRSILSSRSLFPKGFRVRESITPDYFVLDNPDATHITRDTVTVVVALDSARQIRREVLMGLLAELYDHNLSDVIAVKEWLEQKLDQTGREEEPRTRYTNSYLCLKDETRWDVGWSCMCNDRCPTCDAVVEPNATTCSADGHETIHDQKTYNRRMWWGSDADVTSDESHRYCVFVFPWSDQHLANLASEFAL